MVICVRQGDMVDDEAVLLKEVLDCQLVDLKGKTWGLSFQVTAKDPSGHPRCADPTHKTLTAHTNGTAPPLVQTWQIQLSEKLSFVAVWHCRAEHDTTPRFRRRIVYTGLILFEFLPGYQPSSRASVLIKRAAAALHTKHRIASSRH